MTAKLTVTWDPQVAHEDYKHAETYLTLKYNADIAYALVNKLRRSRLHRFHATDLLRAAGREPLPTSDPGVQAGLALVRANHPINPVLIVHFERGTEIADGYHRVSLCYDIDPFMWVPCQVAHLRVHPG